MGLLTPSLSLERLQHLLSYDAASGEFTWRTPTNRRVRAGAAAGSLQSNGYKVIRLDRQLYLAHRLAWFYVHGVWPTQLVDHVNGHRADNRISNLREASFSQNGANSRPRAALKGTWLHRSGKWVAAITVDGKSRHLGVFASRDEAHAAYAAAANEHFGEFARTADFT